MVREQLTLSRRSPQVRVSSRSTTPSSRPDATSAANPSSPNSCCSRCASSDRASSAVSSGSVRSPVLVFRVPPAESAWPSTGWSAGRLVGDGGGGVAVSSVAVAG